MTTPRGTGLIKTQYGDLAITIDPITGRAKSSRLNPLGTNSVVAPRQAAVAPSPGPRIPADEDQPKYRSKLEARYAGYLSARRHVGEIRDIRYEALQVTLAPHTTLRPDFLLDMPDRTVEIHEVKGERVWEDAWVKLKIAAVLWPWFRWYLVRRKKGEWIIKRVPSA